MKRNVASNNCTRTLHLHQLSPAPCPRRHTQTCLSYRAVILPVSAFVPTCSVVALTTLARLRARRHDSGLRPCTYRCIPPASVPLPLASVRLRSRLRPRPLLFDVLLRVRRSPPQYGCLVCLSASRKPLLKVSAPTLPSGQPTNLLR